MNTNATSSDAARIDALNDEAFAAVLSDPERSHGLALEAVELACRVSDATRHASALLNVGIARLFMGEARDALTVLTQARELFQQLGDRLSEARAVGNMATACKYLGNPLQGLEYDVFALTAAREIGHARLLATSLNNLGVTHLDVGNHAMALQSFMQAHDAYRALEDKAGLMLTLLNVGEAYLELAEFQQAEAYLTQALQCAKDVREVHREVYILVDLAALAVKRGNAHAALQHVSDARRTAQDARIHSHLALIERVTGDALTLHGDLTNALAAYDRSVEHARTSQNLTEETRALRSSGRLYLRTADFTRARNALATALAISERAALRADQRDTHLLLSQVFKALGDPESALWQYEAYHAVDRELADQRAEYHTRTLIVQFDLERAREAADAQRAANERLEQANRALQTANEEKTRLLTRVEEQAAHLQRLVREDALTGLHNRRHFAAVLASEFERARRYGHPFVLVMCDVDHFKRVNDTLTHVIGDVVLQRIAGVLRDACRATDTVARYGGEEFVMLLPETTRTDAAVIAQRVRRAVAAHAWQDVNAQLNVTVSVGYACWDGHDTAEEVLAEADTNLYRAKRTGRNRVCGPNGDDRPIV